MDRRWVLSLLAVVALVGPAAAQQPAAAGGPPLLRPGDVVKLAIWREPDLSGEFSVSSDGLVVFPMIGPLRVVDESPEGLRSRLIEAFQRNLRNPSIDVVFLRRVTILGAVRKPGLYPVDATLTVADALALAGGAAPEGVPNRVQLIRGGTRLETQVTAGTRIADSPILSGDELFVPERSWFSRNSGAFVGTLLSAGASIAVAYIIRH